MAAHEVAPHLIAYIDIQGYKKKIQQNENNFLEDILDFPYKIEEILRKMNLSTYKKLKMAMGCENIPIIKHRIFSDNVCIYEPTDEKLEDIIPFVFYCGEMQFNLICENNIAVRGGITFGNFYANEDIVFGSGLVKAVDLEENKAHQLGILVDKEIIEKDIAGLKNLFYKSNGNFYIDYLKVYQNRKQTHKKEDNRLSAHKNFIINNLQAKNDEKVYNKFLWLKKYHNHFYL